LATDLAEAAGAAEACGASGQVYVSWFAAQEADACPARFRAQGEEGWGFPGWSAPLAAASVGRAALDRHLEIHDGSRSPLGTAGALGPNGEPPRPAPLEAVRAWMRAMAATPDCGVGDWVADRIAHRDDATLAATAAGAARWLAGFVRVLGWPLPPRLRLLSAVRGAESRPLRWRAPQPPAASKTPGAGGGADPCSASDSSPGGGADPCSASDSSPGGGADPCSASDSSPGDGRSAGGSSGGDAGRRTGGGGGRAGGGGGVIVASGADARLGRVTGSGDFALVVHRVAAGDDGRVHDRAAFEAVAGALAIGIVPAAVVVTAGDTGERLRVPTDAALLDRGAALVTGVVRQRAIATERGFDAADASPSPGCRHCPLIGDCAPGRDWLAGPGRWRGGLPVL
jgi:hypothetical protein